MTQKKFHDYEKDDEIYYGVGSFLLEIVKVIFWAVIIILPIRIFLFQPFFVQGASMEPSFENGEYLIINEIGYKKTQIGLRGKNFFTLNTFKKLERGDVIVFRFPKNTSQFFIKRVIGLPGETIAIENSEIKIINSSNPKGFILDESSYLSPEVKTAGQFVRKLKDDEYFVMGDNRAASNDSRSWGPLNKDMVIGKVLLRAWPITKAAVY